MGVSGMAKLTMVFGVILIGIGIAGFIATGSAHPTALIPSAIGLILAICGLVANTEDASRRKLWMHIAVTVGLLSFLMTLKSTYDVMLLAHHAADYTRGKAIAIEEKAATCLVSLLFVAFCIRSFVIARTTRTS
jgi:hypothetical protein